MMNRDHARRLAKLEGSNRTDPTKPPQVWFCEDGVCRHPATDEAISWAELQERRATGQHIIALIRQEDDPD